MVQKLKPKNLLQSSEDGGITTVTARWTVLGSAYGIYAKPHLRGLKSKKPSTVIKQKQWSKELSQTLVSPRTILPTSKEINPPMTAILTTGQRETTRYTTGVQLEYFDNKTIHADIVV